MSALPVWLTCLERFARRPSAAAPLAFTFNPSVNIGNRS